MLKKRLMIPIWVMYSILNGCESKTIKIINQGEIKQKRFKATLPFEYLRGLIIVKVLINGVAHDFILDTGSGITIISKQLSQQLNLISIGSITAHDGEGFDSYLDMVGINDIGIGGINFQNTAAMIGDLLKVPEIACFKVDGFIGSNLMKKAIWQIDFKNQTITLTSSIDSLYIPAGSHTINFNPAISGTPRIDILMNGLKEADVSVDLGSNGSIQGSKKTLTKLQANSASMETTFGFGSSGASLFGPGKYDTTFIAKVATIKIGDMVYNNQVMKFSNNENVGVNYFKQFIMTLTWQKSEIILSPINQYSDSGIHTLGFAPSYKSRNIYINFIYQKSQAKELGINLGDQILNFEGMNCINIDPDEYCAFLNDFDKAIKKEQIILTVLTTKGEQRKVSLNPIYLLNNSKI